ncbi:hypothetical protein SNEBB_006239 [Seison nebaliae]|nr:hypothetical protein SNEBB_006239 [Seison nebaliae]
MNSAILFHEKRPQNRLFSTSKCRKSSNGNNRSKRNSTRVVSSTISSATSDVINDIGMDDPTENYRLHLHNQRKGKSQNGFYSKQMLNFQPVSTLSTSFRKTYNNNGIIRRKPPSSSLRELNISDDELSPLTIGSKKCSKFIPAKSKPQSDKKNQPLNHSLFNLVIHNSASSSTSRNNIYNTSHKYDETNCLSSSSSPTDFPLVEKQLSPLQKINSSHKLRGMDIVNKCDVGYTINKQNGKNMNQPLYSLQNDTSVPNNSNLLLLLKNHMSMNPLNYLKSNVPVYHTASGFWLHTLQTIYHRQFISGPFNFFKFKELFNPTILSNPSELVEHIRENEHRIREIMSEGNINSFKNDLKLFTEKFEATFNTYPYSLSPDEGSLIFDAWPPIMFLIIILQYYDNSENYRTVVRKSKKVMGILLNSLQSPFIVYAHCLNLFDYLNKFRLIREKNFKKFHQLSCEEHLRNTYQYFFENFLEIRHEIYSEGLDLTKINHGPIKFAFKDHFPKLFDIIETDLCQLERIEKRFIWGNYMVLHEMDENQIRLNEFLKNQPTTFLRSPLIRDRFFRFCLSPELLYCGSIKEENDIFSSLLRNEKKYGMVDIKAAIKRPTELGKFFKEKFKSVLELKRSRKVKIVPTDSVTSSTNRKPEEKNVERISDDMWKDLQDERNPAFSGGTMATISRMIIDSKELQNDNETLEKLMKIVLERLSDSDSYVYLSAIQCISTLLKTSNIQRKIMEKLFDYLYKLRRQLMNEKKRKLSIEKKHFMKTLNSMKSKDYDEVLDDKYVFHNIFDEISNKERVFFQYSEMLFKSIRALGNTSSKYINLFTLFLLKSSDLNLNENNEEEHVYIKETFNLMDNCSLLTFRISIISQWENLFQYDHIGLSEPIINEIIAKCINHLKCDWQVVELKRKSATVLLCYVEGRMKTSNIISNDINRCKEIKDVLKLFYQRPISSNTIFSSLRYNDLKQCVIDTFLEHRNDEKKSFVKFIRFNFCFPDSILSSTLDNVNSLLSKLITHTIIPSISYTS